jgi:hypothetical protein
MILRYLPSTNRLYVAEMTLTVEDLTDIAKVIASINQDDLIVEFGIMPGEDMLNEDNHDFDFDLDLNSYHDRYNWDDFFYYGLHKQDKIEGDEDELYDDMSNPNKTKGLKIKKDGNKSNR